jgi:hypothetical protein
MLAICFVLVLNPCSGHIRYHSLEGNACDGESERKRIGRSDGSIRRKRGLGWRQHGDIPLELNVDQVSLSRNLWVDVSHRRIQGFGYVQLQTS